MRVGACVCIYCGEEVTGGNCCVDCLKERTKEIAIGAMIGNMELLAELFMETFKKLGGGVEDETRST